MKRIANPLPLPDESDVKGKIDFATADQVIDWIDESMRLRHPDRTIQCDIETNGKDRWTCAIRCVGLGFWTKTGGRRIASIPIRSVSGRMRWSSHDLGKVKRAIKRALDTVTNCGQFYVFDRTILIRHGFKTEDDRPFIDLPVLHHNTIECDCDHSLAFTSSRLSKPPVLWKGDVEHLSEVAFAKLSAKQKAKRDRDLLRYNVRDVHYQMECERMLYRWIAKTKTKKQTRIDVKKSVIAANMSAIGFAIHLPTRLEIHDRLQRVIKKQEERVRAIDPTVKLSNHHHIARWLYDKKGYAPVVTKKGREVAPGEGDRTTNQAALIGLLRYGVDEETAEFIDAKLLHSAHEKLDSTYVRRLPLYRHPKLDPKVYGLARTTFNVHRVSSGRLSSSNPINFENWPKQGPINLRTMVHAVPGHALVSVDFDAGEMRLWAVDVDDRVLISSFVDGIDGHAMNAAAMFATCPSAVFHGTQQEIYEKIIKWKKSENAEEKLAAGFARLCAKKMQFGSQYGAGAERMYSLFRFERDKATNKLTFPKIDRDTIYAWRAAWLSLREEQLQEWIATTDAEVEETGGIRAKGHNRLRSFPSGLDKIFAPRNHAIQSWLAALADDALIKIAKSIGHRKWSYWSGIQNQVHDDIITQVPLDRVNEAAEIMRDAFASTVETRSQGPLKMFGEPEAWTVWASKEHEIKLDLVAA